MPVKSLHKLELSCLFDRQLYGVVLHYFSMAQDYKVILMAKCLSELAHQR